MAPIGKDSPAAKGKGLWRRRGVRFVAIALTALLIVVVLPFAVVLYPTLKAYPETGLPAATSQLEQNRQDIAHLRRLIEVDRSFTPASKAAFTHALDLLEQRAGDLDHPGLAMAAAKAVALADNGHTNVVGLVGGYGFGAVPIRLGWFADGLFVIAAASDQSRLLGGKILEVNGRTTDALVEALRPHVEVPPISPGNLCPTSRSRPNCFLPLISQIAQKVVPTVFASWMGVWKMSRLSRTLACTNL